MESNVELGQSFVCKQSHMNELAPKDKHQANGLIDWFKTRPMAEGYLIVKTLMILVLAALHRLRNCRSHYP